MGSVDNSVTLKLKSSNKATYVADQLLQGSHNLLTAVSSDEEGIFVKSTQKLSHGTQIMSCSALQLALDPGYRTTHCGFCCTTTMTVCTVCHMVAYCSKNCQTQHAKECASLKALHDTFGADLDSSHLLTVRILVQKDDPPEGGGPQWPLCCGIL